MLFGKLIKRLRKDPTEGSEKIIKWIEAQGHPEDALAYLIEKELYEYGERDLSYVIPRRRNDAYFEALLQRESYDARYNTNMDLYDSIAKIHPEHHEPPTQVMPKKVTPVTARPARPTTKPMASTVGKSIPREAVKGHSLSGVNKAKDIYNRTSSAVVVTAPEEQFKHDGVDMTCFDD